MTAPLEISYASGMAVARNLYLYELYGTEPTAEIDVDEVRLEAYAKALLVVAGADGISTAEMEHFVAWQKASGHPQRLIEDLQHFDYRGADAKQVVSAFRDLSRERPEARRALIYDAIRLAWADGRYSPNERAALQAIAEELGIDRTIVVALEGVVSIEIAARQMRLAIFRAT